MKVTSKCVYATAFLPTSPFFFKSPELLFTEDLKEWIVWQILCMVLHKPTGIKLVVWKIAVVVPRSKQE